MSVQSQHYQTDHGIDQWLTNVKMEQSGATYASPTEQQFILKVSEEVKRNM